MKIGWIGVGNMGLPIAKNLCKANFDVMVNDVVDINKEEMISAGARWSDKITDVAEFADIIFTMLPNGNILQSVTLGDPGIIGSISPGKAVVDMSTVAPSESETVAKALEDKGCKLLRAPVTGSTILAEKAELGVIVSGDEALYTRLLPCFRAISNKQFYLGDGEKARVLKLAINLMIGINMQMLAEAMLLADKAGLDWKQTIDIIAESAAASPVVKYKHELVANREYPPAFSVKMMEKDFDLAFDAARQYGAALPISSMTRQMLTAARASGKGEDDFSVLVEIMGNLCK